MQGLDEFLFLFTIFQKSLKVGFSKSKSTWGSGGRSSPGGGSYS
jgi:hypothetical protein